MKTIRCERCQKLFQVKAYRQGAARFCSIACRRTGQALRCARCHVSFYRPLSHVPRGAAYCSLKCARAATGFAPGHHPWNKDLKGLHLSPQSEFKAGVRPINHVPLGTVKIRQRRRDGSRRAWVKVGEPNTWMLRAHLVWIAHQGAIPHGRIIHHKDRDMLNDAIQNLELLTKAEHLIEHREEVQR